MKKFRDFIHSESGGAILLIAAAVMALLISNSPWSTYYHNIFADTVAMTLRTFTIKINLSFIINDCLMAIFFLMVGLEIKHELLNGSLNSPPKAILPAIAALGGIIIPALIYVGINYTNPVYLNGWAIPMATDIAIAIGVLSLLGSRVPTSLKMFLLAIAIFDDLAAIVIIGLFYTAQLSLHFFLLALVCVGLLLVLNRLGVKKLRVYLLVGFALWYCLLRVGVHPTIAGVIVAFIIPEGRNTTEHLSSSERLKGMLHPWVSLAILPIFAFANAGVKLLGISLATLQFPIIFGIFIGLFIGKQIGILSFCWLAVKMGIAQLPEQVRWRQVYGMAIICGIGFTVSIFIGELAFGTVSTHLDSVKIGVLLGSLISGIVGYLLLWRKGVKSDPHGLTKCCSRPRVFKIRATTKSMRSSILVG